MEAIDKAINYLKVKNNIKEDIPLSKEDTLRGLMTITLPDDLADDYYHNQDIVLKKYFKNIKIIDYNDLEYYNNMALYKGDITRIKADAIVTAGNSRLLGCFRPFHNCIDNAVFSFAGLQVRRDLMEIMKTKEYEENGKCKVTKGYNLPSSYIFHTVGPEVTGQVTSQDIVDLTNCYLSCLNKAKEMDLKSIVFCSIATGIYGFPIDLASKIAIDTVNKFLKNNKNIKVIFDVFSEKDYEVYEQTFREIVKGI